MGNRVGLPISPLTLTLSPEDGGEGTRLLHRISYLCHQ